MKSLHNQKGITAISMAILLVIGAFFVMLGLKLVPIYIENFKVRAHLEKMQKDPELRNVSEDEIIKKLFRRFDIDDVEHVKQDDVTLDKEANKLIIHVDYEVRTSTIGNIDLVASFSEKAEIARAN